MNNITPDIKAVNSKKFRNDPDDIMQQLKDIKYFEMK